MSDPVQLTFGSDVADRDGTCGILRRVIVDPDARELTHLVVEPQHGQAAGRLAPIELAVWTADELQLRCSRKDFDGLDEADERLLPTGQDATQATLQALPFARFGGMSGGMFTSSREEGRAAHPIASEVLPVGKAEIRGGDHVYATDGAIGNIKGLMMTLGDHQLTHVLLDEGHIFGKKEVVIPVSAVTGVGDGVVLSLTMDQVRDLPAFDRA